MCDIRIEMLGDKSYRVSVCLMKETPPVNDSDKQDGMPTAQVYPSHVSKDFSAPDMDEVKELVDKYLPALSSHSDEEGFNEAFDKALKGKGGKESSPDEDNEE